MSRKRIDLGNPPKHPNIGSFLRDPAGGYCSCGAFSTKLLNGLCPICRAGGVHTGTATSPMVVPKKPGDPKKGGK
jgi:hypothetical protein